MQVDFGHYKNTDRIIALVDMDCFYVQVEQRRCPEYLGKPCVVVQYNQWKGGGIIAVNYEARKFGIERRGMRGNDAKRKCPDVHLFSVPVERGKANLTRYREAGAEVMEVMCQFSNCVERASIDEAYLDLTEEVNKRLQDDSNLTVTPDMLSNTFVVGWERAQHLEEMDSGELDNREGGLCEWLNSCCSVNKSDRKLAVAATIVEEMRAAVYEKTTFRCSAGIAHNKMLSKLACGLHKPNRQTILPQASIPGLFETIPISKVRSLGGKLGDEIKEKLSIKTMAELSRIKESQLEKHFGEKTGKYLFQLGQGIECEPVTPRQLAKSIGCGKNIRGNTKTCVQHWVNELSDELAERLNIDRQNNNRVASLLCVSFRSFAFGSMSRCCALPVYDSERISKDVMAILQKVNNAPESSDNWLPVLTHIALSASKFQDNLDLPANHIKSFFTRLSNETSETASKKSKLNPKDTSEYFDPVSVPMEASTSYHSTETSIEKKAINHEPRGFFAKKMEEIVNGNSNSSDNFFNSPSKNSAENCGNTIETNPPDIYFQNEETCDDEITSCISNAVTSVSEGNPCEESEFTYRCEQCSKVIPLQDIEEHSDFHYAQNLAKELHSVKPSTSSVPSTSKEKVASKQQKKKGRPRKSNIEKKPNISMKPLEFYMK